LLVPVTLFCTLFAFLTVPFIDFHDSDAPQKSDSGSGDSSNTADKDAKKSAVRTTSTGGSFSTQRGGSVADRSKRIQARCFVVLFFCFFVTRLSVNSC
jgi:hypothetical protein